MATQPTAQQREQKAREMLRGVRRSKEKTRKGLPNAVIVQDSCLLTALGEDHELIGKLKQRNPQFGEPVAPVDPFEEMDKDVPVERTRVTKVPRQVLLEALEPIVERYDAAQKQPSPQAPKNTGDDNPSKK